MWLLSSTGTPSCSTLQSQLGHGRRYGLETYGSGKMALVSTPQQP